MPNINTRINGRRTSANFVVKRPLHGDYWPIPRVEQVDEHSCGFLAALTTIQYFHPKVVPRDVMAEMMPSPTWGCGQRDMIRALKRFGVCARYQDNLSWMDLDILLKQLEAVPIVTVWPDEWVCDHWTVVRGTVDYGPHPYRVVHLSNPAPRGYWYDGLGKNGSLWWKDFLKVWRPKGAALVCTKTE